MSDLASIAKALVEPGKGILAADESNPSANKRFTPLGIEETEEKRRQYRQLLFMTPNIEEYLSGVILYDETIRQSADEGTAMAELLLQRGIIPGIKVDLGLRQLPNFGDEKYTQGLDDLEQRLEEYAKMGAKFTKWRSVITIGDNMPSDQCIEVNAMTLTLYAGIVQAQGMVPIVEPEVLLLGDHSIEDSARALNDTLEALFSSLERYKVNLEGLILKTSMVLPGSESKQQATPAEIASKTAEVLKAKVPSKTSGVVFLSGGQKSEDAIINLNEIAKLGPYDWGVTFSFSRALQDPVLTTWMGKPENTIAAQDVFLIQVKKAAAAQKGEYKQSATDSQDYVSTSQDL